jgi:hypothetical protein
MPAPVPGYKAERRHRNRSDTEQPADFFRREQEVGGFGGLVRARRVGRIAFSYGNNTSERLLL